MEVRGKEGGYDIAELRVKTSNWSTAMQCLGAG